MGVMHVAARVSRPDGRGRAIELRLLVDTGAVYSVLPEAVWRPLKLRPMDRAEFGLADGSVISRDVSECRFEIQGKTATSPVVLGERGDGALLGAVTLETLGLMLNPLTREIRPMRLMLATCPRAVGFPQRGDAHGRAPRPASSSSSARSRSTVRASSRQRRMTSHKRGPLVDAVSDGAGAPVRR
jgi:predicted aspartyl protease